MKRPYSLPLVASFTAMVLLLAACSDSVDQAADTTLAPTTTDLATTTAVAPTTATVAPTTTTTVAPTTTATVALQGHGPFDVMTTVISHESTREISVWAPEAEGSWPIVIAVHGGMGELDRNDLAVTAAELASRGAVVFAADWQPQSAEQDLECGGRYALSVAEEYGGDLNQPYTLIGHSSGGTAVFEGGLNEAAYGPEGSYQACLTANPVPDVIVAISGCYFEDPDGQTYPYDISRYANEDADLVLIAGEEDQICEPWQSQDAAETFRSGGYTVEFVEIEGGNHNTVIFHDCQGRAEGEPSWCVGDERLTLADSPAGLEVVETIFEAIQAAQE